MPKALILVADGSEEIEFVTPYDILTRAGFEIQSAGVNLKNENYAHMTRNIRIVPDHPTLSSVSNPESYDTLILPGGAPGAKTFSNSNDVLQLIASFRAQGKYVAAICAGTTALVAAQKLAASSKTESGASQKVKITSHPSVKDEIKEAGWEYSEERVVVDRRVVTSRGPGTAMLFALTIVEVLVGKEKRDEISGPLIVADNL
ncbi:DJ-1 [Macroventuria anomochaeta]|uniref:DJ-1 n=1 Tax=Macroventuria anomochaeta TaxID=301207 RepID=A0ACB6RLR8_9PLEO|nr:DJ-1 [Macroventuria anomochaeta]KAF2622678.1 DJ-1 [Macroventuria anomochaeta]